MTPRAVILADPGRDRVTALHPGTGAVLAEVGTEASVLAVGTAGMVLGAGRDLAFVAFR